MKETETNLRIEYRDNPCSFGQRRHCVVVNGRRVASLYDNRDCDVPNAVYVLAAADIEPILGDDMGAVIAEYMARISD